MIAPYYESENCTLYLGDCLEVMKQFKPGSVDAVVTDPPYPDYHVELYGEADISWLTHYSCRQLIFWSAKADFPLDYSARHVWDKRKGGVGSAYEFIYERNGGCELWVFNYISPNNTVRANLGRDCCVDHPSQKPIQLLLRLVRDYTEGITILDPFMGSGTTGVACVKTGRKFIGIEIDEGYAKIAEKRIREAEAQGALDYATAGAVSE